MSAPAIATRINTGLQRATGTSQKRTLQLCQPAEALPRNDGVIRMAPTRLTTQDYVQVMLATIREGVSHARWPRDVVAQFMTAEVVSDGE